MKPGISGRPAFQIDPVRGSIAFGQIISPIAMSRRCLEFRVPRCLIAGQSEVIGAGHADGARLNRATEIKIVRRGTGQNRRDVPR